MVSRGVIFVGMILAAAAAVAQSAKPGFSVQTENGQTTFHPGERIPLTLTFTSPDDTDFHIAPWENERGEEFGGFEEYQVTPASGWSDPLREYFDGRFPTTTHGWPWEAFKKAHPVTVKTDLNQWVRFEQPGDYLVRVVSHRVCREGQSQSLEVSATVALHIVDATPEWQKETLQSIRAVLAGRINQRWSDAMDDLRFLGTGDAIDDLTEKLGQPIANADSEAMLGLIAMPISLRPQAIASVNRRLNEPGFAVSWWYVCAMQYLQISPDLDGKAARQEIRNSNAALWSAIDAAAANKTAEAKATTEQTLLLFGHNTRNPNVSRRMAAVLPDSFLQLDINSQILDLEIEWNELRKPQFAAVLAALAKTASDMNQSAPLRDELQVNVFRRWFELDPEGARREMLDEIGSATPKLSATALSFRPPEPLPQFESVWAAAFLAADTQRQELVLGPLLVRFGTGAATQTMIEKLKMPPHPYSCNAHVAALAYLVRFQSAEARPLLEREVKDNVAGCGANLITWITQEASGPALNDVAVENLGSSDVETVRTAIQYLTLYGRKEDEERLQRRYHAWIAEWKGKAAELDDPRADQKGDPYRLLIGGELANALLANQGWLADPALLTRLEAECVGREMCDGIENTRRLAATPYRVQVPSGIVWTMQVTVAQYAPQTQELLDAKVAQFPKGTHFVLTPVGPTDPQELDKVRALFEKHGMVLDGTNQ